MNYNCFQIVHYELLIFFESVIIMLLWFSFVAFCVELIYLLFFSWLTLDTIHLAYKESKFVNIKHKFIIAVLLHTFVFISVCNFFNSFGWVMNAV